jgi:uncharacterized surface protein with fasciclin (FAS1) repeats
MRGATRRATLRAASRIASHDIYFISSPSHAMQSMSFASRVSNARAFTAAPVKSSSTSRTAVRTRAGSLIETARANGLNAFADAVDAAGLTATLSTGTYTVFAPNDEAMKAFTNPDGTHAIEDVLKFHCIKGKIQGKHVTNYPLIMTLEGTKIAIDSKTFKAEGKIEVGAPPQGTQGLAGRVDGGFIVQTDIEADNGVIHIIDGVASPKVPLIGQNGGYVAGTEPGSGEGRTGLDVKVSSK